MRSWARVFRPSILTLVLIGGPFVPTLSAGGITYNFSGTVQTVSASAEAATGVMPNFDISGSFAYDPTESGTSGTYTFTGSSKVHSFTFKVFNNVTGAQVFTDSYSGNVTAYYAIQLAFSSSSGTSMSIMGDTIYKQGLGVTGPGPPPAFDLTLVNPSNAGGYSPTNLPLPTSSVITHFVSNTAVLNWDPDQQSFTAAITQFSAIPEPSSLLLGSLGMATSLGGFLIYRRKPRGVRAPG